mgnify:CR=1 FL=1
MGMCGYDRVIVEPSGIYDVDEFFDTLHEEPLDGWYRIGNVITVLDSNLEEDLPEGAEFLLASQAANAGCVVLSKTQETTEEEQKNAVSEQHHPRHKCDPKENKFCRKDQTRIIVKINFPDSADQLPDHDHSIHPDYHRHKPSCSHIRFISLFCRKQLDRFTLL